ncbi:MAG: exo-alpha-sialidase [Planctomycetes bacterium]|nr:exo-alpha-sialidase [Planctomycetota bacterium]
MASKQMLLVVAASILFTRHLLAADVVFDVGGFEDDIVDQVPVGWRAFHLAAIPSVEVVRRGVDGSRHSLRGERSESGGWTALSRDFDSPQQRAMIEFSFAFSKTSGRSLNIWTHEPGGKDASQFNLCIQNGALMQFDGRSRTWEEITRKIQPTLDPLKPIWHRLRAIVDAKHAGIDYWISAPHSRELPAAPVTRQAYRTNLPIGAIDLVSGTRIAPGAWYLVDDLVVTAGQDLPEPHKVEPLREAITLWTGAPITSALETIPFVPNVRHHTIHRAMANGYKFLHGAAIVHHDGVFYANWANSPVNENGPHETLQGRRSNDGGKSWSKLEVIGPGFDGAERHSHGVLFVHNEELWTICARFGVGTPGRRFPGLKAEAFVLNEQSDRWESRGIVMKNCWPYDEPVRMADGNLITGGQDKDGLPVVAISHGEDLTRWDSTLIPFDPRLKPSYAETTVWAEGNHVIAVIRGGRGVAWISTSNDCGRTWSKAGPSNLPMPRAKAYLGKLSTGQLYLVSNINSRDTLVISISNPGELTLSKMWRLRHGKSAPPRFSGKAKGKQWSYPYGYEHDGKLYVVYSIGKEDCGLSVLPIDALAP